MPEEPARGRDEIERVSRLTGSIAQDADEPAIRRQSGLPREEKAKRKQMPRSYSTLRVTEDEKLWAAVAHGSVWITLVTSILSVGVLVPVSIFIPLLIYVAFRKRSDFVAFHALQAFVLQLLGTVGALAVLFVGGTVWVIGFVISLLAMAILVGFILVPVWAIVGFALLLITGLMPLAMLLFGTIAAVETYHGRDYRYPFVARWVDRQLAGGFLRVS